MRFTTAITGENKWRTKPTDGRKDAVCLGPRDIHAEDCSAAHHHSGIPQKTLLKRPRKTSAIQLHPRCKKEKRKKSKALPSLSWRNIIYLSYLFILQLYFGHYHYGFLQAQKVELSFCVCFCFFNDGTRKQIQIVAFYIYQKYQLTTPPKERKEEKRKAQLSSL